MYYTVLGKSATKLITEQSDKYGYICEISLLIDDIPGISVIEGYDSKKRIRPA